MRRRLDLAASMILAPAVLFLDEPTTGLDPRSRGEVWESVRALVAGGTTVLLTTQYLEEADKLASHITVIDQGRAIADDTPDGLKNTVGGDRIEVVVAERSDIPRVVKVVARVSDGEPEADEAELRVHAPVTDRVAALTEVARTLQDEGVARRGHRAAQAEPRRRVPAPDRTPHGEHGREGGGGMTTLDLTERPTARPHLLGARRLLERRPPRADPLPAPTRSTSPGSWASRSCPCCCTAMSSAAR